MKDVRVERRPVAADEAVEQVSKLLLHPIAVLCPNRLDLCKDGVGALQELGEEPI